MEGKEEKIVKNKATILIVDDNTANRKVLNDMILTLGHTPLQAENGQSALAKIQNQSVDLVLLDILMPVMDGYQVLENLKADGVLRDLPVIMISALGEMESVVRCIEKGADEYVVKPFNPTLLKARINGSLDKKRLRDREREWHTELERNFAALQRAEQTRDGLFHMIIHDLNNPLANIQLSAEMLMAKVSHDKFDREGSAKYLRFISQGTQEISTLIKGILDVSKLEAGEMPVSLISLDAAPLIKDLCESFSTKAKRKNVHLSFEFESDVLMIKADKELFFRILQNLLTNALKHNPRGTNIIISMTRHEKDVIISVTDNGPGISEKYKDKIFEKFFQAEVRNEAQSYGVGLGLTFCKMAVEAQRGEIWVESREGEGTSFKVALKGA